MLHSNIQIKSQQEFFNRMAYNWDEICNHDMKKVEYILDLMEIKAGSSILDVGTGTGVLISSLSKRVTKSGHIKGVDIAEKMIEVAKQKNSYENVVFECKDALEYKDDEGYYDHIICYSMFPHFKDKEEAIKKLSEKLKIGGKLSICHSQSREAINNLHKGADKTVKEDNLPTLEIIKKYFLDTNLKIFKEIDNEEFFVVIGFK